MWPSSPPISPATQPVELLNLTKKIHDDSRHALQTSIPSKILSLTALIDTFSLPTSPFNEIRSVLLELSVEDSHLGKKRKLDSSGSFEADESARRESGLSREISQRLEVLFHLVEGELEELCDFARKLRLSRALNQTCSVEDDEDCIAEFNKATDGAQRALGDPIKYYAARATWSLAVHENPAIREYASARLALDRNAVRNCKQCLIRVRDVYLILVNISQKHLASQ